MDNQKIANISRVVFTLGAVVTVAMTINAIAVSADSKNLTDAGKKFRNNIWYGTGATAIITIIAGYVGTKAYNK